jgi:hypothetical protein
MGIDMRGFDVIYKGRVFNAVNIMPNYEYIPSNGDLCQPTSIDVWFVNEDGILTLIRDEARKFRFVKKEV